MQALPVSPCHDPIARQAIRGTLLAAAVLEQGIADVEDAVSPLAKVLPASPTLIVLRDQVTTLDSTALTGTGTSVPLERIAQRLFALAALREGRPRPANDLLQRPAVAAVVLIVRECMHHPGYRQVRFLWDPALASTDGSTENT